jgi:glycosyltransferase involved in cell wall biosynthesis
VSDGRVSVVVPAHDAAATVADAIRSVLAQTRPADEIVVVDDGSTDDTVAVVRSFGGAVRLVSQPQSGPSSARNAGAAATTGEWLAFLDADDAWHPAKLERQLRVADHAAIVATDWTRGALPEIAPDRVGTTRISTRDILVMNRFQTSTVLLRRRAFDASGGFDPALDGVEDWDMWLRASRHGPVVKLDWPFVRYVDVGTGYSKASERVYRTGASMLEREVGPDPGHEERAVLAYHHLRWAIAFRLMGDPGLARVCLVELRRRGLLRAVPEGTARFLVPYLAWRADRRFRRTLRVLRPGSGGAAAR